MARIFHDKISTRGSKSKSSTMLTRKLVFNFLILLLSVFALSRLFANGHRTTSSETLLRSGETSKAIIENKRTKEPIQPQQTKEPIQLQQQVTMVQVPQQDKPVVNREYPKVRLYTLANEVVALMTSMATGTSSYGKPLVQHQLPHRALVFYASAGRIHEVYPLIFAARTLGDWTQDIVVLGEGIASLQKEALTCLNAKFIDALLHPSMSAFETELAWTKNTRALNKLLLVYFPEFREYDIIQFHDLDTVIIGPIKRLNRIDFDTNLATLFEEMKSTGPCPIQTTQKRMDTRNVESRNPNGICVSTASFGIFTWNLGKLDGILGRINEIANLVSLQRPLDDSSETQAQILMQFFEGQWQSKWLGGTLQTTLSDPLLVENQPLVDRKFSYIVTDGRLGRPALIDSPYHSRYVFTTFLAGALLGCHSSVSSIIDPGKERFKLDMNTISKLKDISRDYLEGISGKNKQSTVTFKERYNEIGRLDASSLQNKNQQDGEPRRVLVFWASKGYVEGAYAVAFQARTVGQWHEDMILLSDEVSDENKQALDCLKVKVLIYNREGYKERFPWVAFNHWYYKLLPFLLPELREYDIVQYLDLDVIVTGPLKQRRYSDFEPGVHVLMEDNNHDTSIIEREHLRQQFSKHNEDINAFVKRFPGADERNNGPNNSPSAGACFYSFLVSKVESIEELYKMFSDVAKDYYKVLKFGDQPLIMLAFWGRWRMTYGNLMWQAKFERVFDDSFRHDRTQGIVRFIHTGGGLRPALPSSPYKPIEVFTNKLAADLLNCPAILAGGTTMKR